MKWYLNIFFFCFLVFNSNVSILGTKNITDTTPNRLIPFAVLSGDGMYLDRFFAGFKTTPLPYYVVRSRGHIISAYPIMSGLVSTPVYVPIYFYLAWRGHADPASLQSVAFALEKISASLIASLSVVFFFIFIRQLTKRRKTALLFSLLFAMGTQTFSTSSQALWQHGIANLFFVVSQIYLLRALSSKDGLVKWYSFSLGFAVLCVFSRYNFIIYLFILTLFLLLRDTKRWQLYSAISIAGLACVLGYNMYFFGTVFGSPQVALGGLSLANVPMGLFGELFSPVSGMLFYTPFMFFAFFGLGIAIKQIHTGGSIIRMHTVYFLSVLLFNANWHVWWGGSAWGDRLLADGAVSAIVLSLFVYEMLRSPIAKGIFVLSCILAIVAQIVGVFYYRPLVWDLHPTSVQMNPHRLWSLSDNPFVRNILLGPNMSGIYSLYYSFSHMQSRVYTGTLTACRLTFVGATKLLGQSIVQVKLNNDSTVDWVTSGAYPLGFVENVYYTRTFVENYPIPLTLPPVIRAGDSVDINIPLVLDSRTGFLQGIRIMLAQDDGTKLQMFEGCALDVRLKPKDSDSI